MGTRGIPDASLMFGVTASCGALVYSQDSDCPSLRRSPCRHDTRLCTFIGPMILQYTYINKDGRCSLPAAEVTSYRRGLSLLL
jgi:hypothetical protein